MLRKIDSSEAIYVTEKERKYKFFTLRKRFPKLSLGEKLIPEILEKKLEKNCGYAVILENKKRRKRSFIN